ncbi:MAG: PorV/PorQ family protein [Calditrichaeota bacterium]|nr:PorV/PorQ family protein [Calditrichota bacterium]
MMRIDRAVIKGLFLNSLLVVALLAGTGFRKYAGEFMAIDVSPRAQALGGSFVALANDVTASYYNPAGLVNLQATQFSFMHAWQFVNFVNFDYLAVAHPIGYHRVLGISVSRLAVDDIPDTRAALIQQGDDWRLDWSRVTRFNSADYVVTVALGQRWNERLSWGVSVKLIRRNLGENYANGIGVDGGLQFQLRPNWRLGLSLKNMTTTLIAWDTGEKELVYPMGILGTAYRFRVPGMDAYFIPNLDVILRSVSLPGAGDARVYNFEGGIFTGAVGGEFQYRGVLSFRAGIDELQRFAFGIGVKIPHIRVDYSFLNYARELGNSHRIGILLDFGN